MLVHIGAFPCLKPVVPSHEGDLVDMCAVALHREATGRRFAEMRKVDARAAAASIVLQMVS